MPGRAAALVAIGCLLLGACSGDSSPSSPSSSSSSPAPSVTPSTSAGTTATSAPTTTGPALQPAATPSEAATQFVGAWRNGDRAAASTIAVPEAVDAVFGAGDPGRIQSRGCNTPPEGPVLCVYATGQGELQVRVSPAFGGGFVVDQARLTPV